MAIMSDTQNNLNTNFTQTGLEGIEKILSNIDDMIAKLPAGARTGSAALKTLVDALKNMPPLMSGTDASAAEQVTKNIKALMGELQRLKTMEGAAKLITEADIRLVDEQEKAVNKLANTYRRLQDGKKADSGTLGLDSTDRKDVNKSLTRLQKEIDARLQMLTKANADEAKLLNDQIRIREENIRKLGELGNKITTDAAAKKKAEDDKKAADAAAKKKSEDDKKAADAAKKTADAKAEADRKLAEDDKARADREAKRDADEKKREDARAVSNAKRLRERQKDLEMDIQLKAREENVSGQRAAEYKAVVQAENMKGMNLQGQWQQFIANRNNERNQQYSDYNVSPQKRLEAMTYLTNKDGQRYQFDLGKASSLQKIDTSGNTPEKIVAAQLEVLRIQTQLVNLSKDQTHNEQDRLNLLTKLVEAKKKEQGLTQDQRTQKKEDDNVSNMLSKIQGRGGAALMAIQANLMFNYSILSNVIGAMKNAVTTSVELEAAFRNVQAVTATTSTEMGGLEGKIKAIAAESKFSSKEVADAALTLGQAGLSATQVGDSLKAVTTLASASGTTLANTVDLVTSVIGVFDKQANDTVDVANKITQAANTSKVSVEKLALGFQYVGNTASQLGISFEETTAALATMSNAGIKSGSTMGTGLNQFLTEVQKPTKEFVRALSSVGLGLDDLDFKSKGLMGVLRTLKDAGFTASDAIKGMDTRGARAFNALVANPEDFERQLRDLGNTQAAVKANEIQMDSLKAQSARLTTSLGNLASVGFEPISTLLKGMASGFATLVQAMAECPGPIKAIGAAFGALILAAATNHIVGLIDGFLRLPAAAAAAAGGVSRLAAAGQLLSSAFGTVSLTSGLLFGALIIGAGAYYVHQKATQDARLETDRLQAAFDKAKSAVDEKSSAIKSLSEKISELQQKEQYLNSHTNDLREAQRQLVEQYGKWGLASDTVNSSISETINRLRNLRGEVQKLKGSALDAAISAQEGVVADAEKKARISADKVLKPQFGQEKSIGDQLSELTSSNKLTPEQREVLKGAIPKLKSDDATIRAQGLTDASNMVKIAQRNATSEKDLGYNPSGYGSYGTDVPLVRMNKMQEQLSDALTNSQELRSQNEKLKVLKADAKYEAFSSASGGIPDEVSILSRRPGMRADSMENIVAARADAKAALANLKTEEAKIADNIAALDRRFDNQERGLSKEDYDAQRRVEESRLGKNRENQSGIRKQVQGITSSALQNADVLQAVDGSTLAQEIALATKKLRRGTGTAGERSSLIQSKSDLEVQRFAIKNGYMDDAPEVLEFKKSKDREAQAKINNYMDPKGRVGADPNDKAEEEALLIKAAAKAAEAKNLRNSMQYAPSMEKVEEAWDAALKARIEEKGFRVEALMVKQRREAKDAARKGTPLTAYTLTEQKEALEAFKEGQDQSIQQFIDGTVSLRQAAMKKLDESTKKVEDAKKKLAAQKLEGQDRIEGEEDKLAEMDVKIAEKNGVKGTAYHLQVIATNQAKLVEYTAQLETLGDESSGMIGALANQLATAKAAREKAEAALAKYANRDPKDFTTAERSEFTEQTAILDRSKKDETTAAEGLRGAQADKKSLRKNVQTSRITIAKETEQLPVETTIDNINAKIKQSWDNYTEFAKSVNIVGIIGDGLDKTLAQSTNTMADLFTQVVSGTMSIKNAFKSMAVSVVKSLMEMIAKALVWKAVQTAIGWYTGGSSGSSGGDLGAVGGMNMSAGSGSGTVTAATGGYFNRFGGIDRVKKMAAGGPITGGTPGIDSVPVMAMPGEFMLNKKAVDAVGTDYLHGLNQQGNRVVSSSQPKGKNQSGSGDVVNVYVVTPDQQPGMGPKDIVVAVSDDIARGGSIKKLIKQVQLGQA